MTKTKEELRAEYEQVLDYQDRNLIRHDDPRSARIVAAASKRLLSLFPSVGPVRLVATAEAMSLVTPDALKRIEAKSGPVALSCQWLWTNATNLRDYPLIVEPRASYTQPVERPPAACVVFEPVIRERSVARALLLIACEGHAGVPIHLVTFSAVRRQVAKACDEFLAMMEKDDFGPVTVHAFDDLGRSDPKWFTTIMNGPMSELESENRQPIVVVQAREPAIRRIYRIDEDPVAA